MATMVIQEIWKYNTDTGFIYIDTYVIVKEKSYIKSISDIFAFTQDGLYGNLFLEVLNATTPVNWLYLNNRNGRLSMYYCDKISEGFTRNLTSSWNTLSVMCLL